VSPERDTRVELAALQSEVRAGLAGVHLRIDDLFRVTSGIGGQATEARAVVSGVEVRVGMLEQQRPAQTPTRHENGNGGSKLRDELKFYVWIAAGSVGGTISFLYFIGKL
jgi:hypothetical protein